jgi:tetratricopeptide (TPR) repeat protein
VIRIWFRIPSNNALHYFLSIDTVQHRKIIQSCGLHYIPDRRTFDRRFKVIPVQNMICTIGQRLLREDIVESYVGAADSAIIQSKKAWQNKGEALKLKKRFEDAITCYEKAILLNPDYYMSYVAMADALSRLGRVEKSQQCMQKAAHLNPEYVIRWMISNLAHEDLIESCNMEAILH